MTICQFSSLIHFQAVVAAGGEDASKTKGPPALALKDELAVASDCNEASEDAAVMDVGGEDTAGEQVAVDCKEASEAAAATELSVCLGWASRRLPSPQQASKAQAGAQCATLWRSVVVRRRP